MKRNREGEGDRAGKKGRERLRGVGSDSKYGRSVDTEMERQRAVQTSGGESHEEIGKQKSREREREPVQELTWQLQPWSLKFQVPSDP